MVQPSSSQSAILGPDGLSAAIDVGTKIRTWIGYSQLFDERVPLRTIKKKLREFKLSSVVEHCARINTLIVVSSLRDSHEFFYVQRTLEKGLLDDEILGQLNARFGPGFEEHHTIFFPRQILTVLATALEVCSEGGPIVITGRNEGGASFGRCCVMMTDHLVSKREEAAISKGTSVRNRENLLIQTAPSRELHNPPSLPWAIERLETMFSDVLLTRKTRKWLARELKGFDLPKEFRAVTGLSLAQYRDLVFVTFAYYYTKSADQFLDNPITFRLDPSKYRVRQNARAKNIRKFLKLDSIKLQDLPAECRSRTVGARSMDFTVFRMWPLVEYPDGTLVCLNPAFLLEKLSSGFNWTIVNSFVGDKVKSKRALDGFGHLFERYVDKLMRDIYPVDSKLFASFPEFANGNEAFDGVLMLGEHLVVCEYKGGFLKSESKYSGRLKQFREEFDKKFGLGKEGAVRQLATKIEKLFHRDPTVRRKLPGLDEVLKQTRKVTPVLIVQEPLLRFEFCNWMLNRRFEQFKQKWRVTKSIEIAPLQLIDIETLQQMKPYLVGGDFRLDQCLNARAQLDPELLSAFQTFPWKRYFPSLGTREDTEVHDRFRAVIKRARRTVFGEMRDAPDEST